MNLAVPILLYHSISDDASAQFKKWTVSPRDFAAQMGYLHENGFTPLTVTRLARVIVNDRVALPERPVVISFDDGFADFYSRAFPVLDQYGFSATLYVVSGYVDGSAQWLQAQGDAERPMLTWGQIAALDAAGVEIGGHTQTHTQLDTLPPGLAQEQIRGSKLVLEQQLGKRITSFAYPHGYYSSVVRHMVRQAGFLSACGVKHAMSSMKDDRFALARIIVSSGTSLAVFGGLLAGRGLRVAPAGERVRTRVWRLFRRSMFLLRTHYSVSG
jgi:peptidoglycan/xylan/chitin deacetylase (PgdA/CDA1 family)